MRIISAIKLKKYIVSASIFGIIISKLCHGKKPCLINLLQVDNSLEVGFYCIILPFSLAIYLQIENNKKFLLYAKEIT